MVEPPAAPYGPSRWSRRDVLRLGAGVPAVAFGLGACTVDPTVDDPQTPGRSTGTGAGPSPGSTPTVPAAAQAEQALSVLAAAILTGPRRGDLDGRQRTLLAFLRDAHAQHATALAGADPGTRPTSADPAPSAAAPNLAKTSLKDALARLVKAEGAQAGRLRRTAVTGSGLAALLSGSIAVGATTFAGALTAGTAPGVVAIGAHRPAPLLTDIAATQAVVAQLHAMVYGYQLALGRLKVGSDPRARAYRGLADTRATLDDLTDWLDRRSADVPAAEAAYVPDPDPRDASSAATLVQRLHTRLQPYAGILLAAAGTDGDRSYALGLLGATTSAARRWGAPVRAWPGWPD